MTRPSKLQDQACERFAEALVMIAEGARLDGKGSFGLVALGEVAGRLAEASSAFDADQIVARALERRGRALGLRTGTGELLALMEDETKLPAMLLLPDADFRATVEAIDQELGGI